MSDLVEFLYARLRDDEQVAKRVAPNQAPNELRAMVTRDSSEPFLIIDSARILREVEAKRRILERYEQQAAKQGENAMEEDRAWTLEPVLAELALPYADHPDYDQSWRV